MIISYFRAYFGPAAVLQSTTLPPPLLPALIPSPGGAQHGAVIGDGGHDTLSLLHALIVMPLIGEADNWTQ